MNTLIKVTLIALTGVAVSGCLSNTQSTSSRSPTSAPSVPSTPSGGAPGTSAPAAGGTVSTPSGTISTDFPSMPSLPSGSTSGSKPGSKSGSGKGQQAGSASTSGGSVGDLDRTLDESLDTFEDTIATRKGSEDGDIYDSYPAPKTSGGSGALFEELEDSDWEASAESEKSDGGGQGGGEGGDADMAASEQNTPSGPVPEDVDDGSDDDIVARQLREAAMSETDPVLREKLWDEYRRYKNQ